MHIGRKIKEIIDAREHGQNITRFAQELHCDRRNVYYIFSRATVDTELLMHVSLVLRHNFFLDLADEYNARLAEIELRRSKE